jgi:hypothetical protein
LYPNVSLFHTNAFIRKWGFPSSRRYVYKSTGLDGEFENAEDRLRGCLPG